MSNTPHSFLERLRLHSDPEDWDRFVTLYTSWLRDWLRKEHVNQADQDDLLQDVLMVVLRELPRFQHNQRPGAFRKWLRTILMNRLRAHWRVRQATPQGTGDSDLIALLAQLEDPASNASQRWDLEYDQHILNQLMEQIRAQFQPSTWTAFHSTVVEGRNASQVADTLNLSINAVLCAKSRVLRKLRHEAKGLID